MERSATGQRGLPWGKRVMLRERVIALVLTGCFGALGYDALANEVAVSDNAASARGVVTGVDQIRKQPDTVLVSFSTPDGQQVEVDLDGDGYSLGDKVEITYNPDHPTRARIKGDHGQLLSGSLYSALAAFGLVVLIRPDLGRRRRNNWQ